VGIGQTVAADTIRHTEPTLEPGRTEPLISVEISSKSGDGDGHRASRLVGLIICMVIAISARSEWELCCVCVMDTVRGWHNDGQQMPLPGNASKPGLSTQNAFIRTAKRNVTWKGKGLGRVHAMACGVAVLPEGDLATPRQTVASLPVSRGFSVKFAFHLGSHV
jgi:hypothetical protein